MPKYVTERIGDEYFGHIAMDLLERGLLEAEDHFTKVAEFWGVTSQKDGNKRYKFWKNTMCEEIAYISKLLMVGKFKKECPVKWITEK